MSLVANEIFRFTPAQELSFDQAAIVRNSFSRSDLDPMSIYVNRILDIKEFHSVATNLWYYLGVAGLGLVLILIIFVAKNASALASNLAAENKKSPNPELFLVVYASLRMFWDLTVSPTSDLKMWPLYAIALIPAVRIASK